MDRVTLNDSIHWLNWTRNVLMNNGDSGTTLIFMWSDIRLYLSVRCLCVSSIYVDCGCNWVWWEMWLQITWFDRNPFRSQIGYSLHAHRTVSFKEGWLRVCGHVCECVQACYKIICYHFFLQERESDFLSKSYFTANINHKRCRRGWKQLSTMVTIQPNGYNKNIFDSVEPNNENSIIY